MNRENIFRTLFATIADIPQVKTASREFRSFSSVAPEDMPAVFMTCRTQGISYGNRMVPPVYTFDLSLFVYVFKQETEKSSQEVLNEVLDALDVSLEALATATADPLNESSITQCRVMGTIETDEGALGDLAVAIVPVQVIAV
jgi:hypothetical protein